MNSILGLWLFVGLIYRGAPMAPPNPDLKITFSFESSNRNELFYYRVGERGFCRRWAQYEIQDGFLKQTITEVDPENNSSCSQDTDMQMGRTSVTPIELTEKELHLRLPLGEEELIYIFQRQIDSP